MATPDEIREHVRRYYAAVSAGDIERVLTMFTADAEMRDPVGAPAASDDMARRHRYAGIGAAFETFTIAPGVIRVGGDEAAATWSASARAKNGRDLRFDGISAFAFDGEGRITRMWAFLDMEAIAAAMAG